MSLSVVCRRCGLRVQLPEGLDLRKARCSKCRTSLGPAAHASNERPTSGAVLALDERKEPETVYDLDGPEPQSIPEKATKSRPLSPRPFPTRPEVPVRPPFRFTVQVVADSWNQLPATPLHAVLTSAGLFLEVAPNHPIAFVPVGTKSSSEDSVVRITLSDRAVAVRLGSVGEPDRLAKDTVAFLAGERSLPSPDEYRRPLWLVGVGAILALALSTGPVVLSETAELPLGIGVVLGLIFAGLATVANVGIALFTRYPVGGKVALMAGVCLAMLVLFLLGVIAFFTERRHEPPTPSDEALPTASPSRLPTSTPTSEDADRGPPSYLALVRRDGMSRLDDGPAVVTAMALSPRDGAMVIGYADGTTLIWQLDQSSFEPPRPGPRGDGPVRRIEFDSTGTIVFLHGSRGVVAAALNAPPRTPVEIPGELVAVFPKPTAERFAAVRSGRIRIRYLPITLVRKPPSSGAMNGFVRTGPKDEAIPAGTRPEIVSPTKPTFAAWHPAERLLVGGPDGRITAWLPTGGQAPTTIRGHSAAVRTWATGPNWPDFATGDDRGFVGYWPDKSLSPQPLKTGDAAVAQLAFSPCGGELVVADAVGALSLWNLPSRTREFEVKRREPVAAVAFGPQDDILLVADGKGVEVWWLPELAARAMTK